MRELGTNHSVHLIREIIVPDGEVSCTLARLRDTWMETW